MKLRQYIIKSTTSAGGASTDESESSIFGLLYAVYHNDGDYANNVTVDITYSNPAGDDVSVLALGAGVADDGTMFYPRQQVHDAADGGVVWANDDGDEIQGDLPIIDGKVTVTIGAGGDTKSGSETLYVYVNG